MTSFFNLFLGASKVVIFLFIAMYIP